MSERSRGFVDPGDLVEVEELECGGSVTWAYSTGLLAPLVGGEGHLRAKAVYNGDGNYLDSPFGFQIAVPTKGLVTRLLDGEVSWTQRLMWEEMIAFGEAGSEKAMGVSPELLRRVIDGREGDLRKVFAAEGQMMRCFTKAIGLPSKAVFFDCWLLCMSRLAPLPILWRCVKGAYGALLGHVERVVSADQSSVFEIIRLAASANHGVEEVGGRLARVMANVREKVGVRMWPVVVAKEEWHVLDHPEDVTSLCIVQWLEEDTCIHLGDRRAEELREEYLRTYAVIGDRVGLSHF